MSEEIKTELNEDETVCPLYPKNLRNPRKKPTPPPAKLNPFFRRMTSKSLVHLTIQGKKMIQMA